MLIKTGLLILGLTSVLFGSVVDFDKKNCKIKINKKHITICYSNENKGPIRLFYALSKDSNFVTKEAYNRKFYREDSISIANATNISDYLYTDYIMKKVASEKIFNYQEDVYTSANTIPINPYIVDKLKEIEEIEVVDSNKIGYITIETVIEYKNKDNFLKTNEKNKDQRIRAFNTATKHLLSKKIRIPSGIWKKLSNGKKNYEKCFYVENKINFVNFKTYKIDCNEFPEK